MTYFAVLFSLILFKEVILRMKAQNTKMLPITGVILIVSSEFTIKPPINAPIAIPVFMAEILNAEATPSEPGFSLFAKPIESICEAGTFDRASRPKRKRVTIAAVLVSVVHQRINNTILCKNNIPANAVIGFLSEILPPMTFPAATATPYSTRIKFISPKANPVTVFRSGERYVNTIKVPEKVRMVIKYTNNNFRCLKILSCFTNLILTEEEINSIPIAK